MWRRVKLGEICEISIGKTPPRGDKRFWDKEKKTDNVWLSIADLTAVSGKFVSDSKEYVSDEGAKLFKPVPQNTLVMSFKLSIGKLAITERELRTNEAIAALPIKNESLVSKEFLYHYLSSLDWGVIAGNDEKVKGKTLNKKKLNALEVILPPLAEQQRIVAKLDAAFAEIDRVSDKINESYESADTLFDSCLRYVFGELEYKDSPNTLTDVTELIVDCEHKTAPTQDTGIALVRTPNIKKGELDLDTAKRISEETYEVWTRRGKPASCDLILAREAPAGNVGIVPQGQKVCLGQRTVLIRANRELITPQYLCYFLLHPEVQSSLLSKSTGATVEHVNLKDIRSMPVPRLPPIPSQIKAVSSFENMLRQRKKLIDAINQKKQLVKQLKSATLAQELQPPQSEAA